MKQEHYEWRTSRGAVAMTFNDKRKAQDWGRMMREKHGAAWPGHKLYHVMIERMESIVEPEEKWQLPEMLELRYPIKINHDRTVARLITP